MENSFGNCVGLCLCVVFYWRALYWCGHHLEWSDSGIQPAAPSPAAPCTHHSPDLQGEKEGSEHCKQSNSAENFTLCKNTLSFIQILCHLFGFKFTINLLLWFGLFPGSKLERRLVSYRMRCSNTDCPLRTRKEESKLLLLVVSTVLLHPHMPGGWHSFNSWLSVPL